MKSTNIAYATIEGTPALAWAMENKHDRPPLPDEAVQRKSPHPHSSDGRAHKADGLVLLPNIDSAETLIAAYEVFSFAPMPSLFSESEGEPTARQVLDAMGIKATRTNITRTKEAIQTWHCMADSYSLIPIGDCMAVSRDLRALLSAYMYSLDVCSIDSFAKNMAAGLAFADSDAKGHRFYRECLNSVAEPYQISLHLWEDEEPKIRAALEKGLSLDKGNLSDICTGAINAFMTLAHPAIAGRQFFAAGEVDGIGNAYAFWAEKILDGKAGVCDRCGNLFIRQRNTKRFCSHSCTAAASSAKR